MKKWLRRILMVVALIALTLGVVYEVATHVGRGWLFGEAFYLNRPTSYWRAHCDEWLERFETPKQAASWIPPGISVPMLGDEIPFAVERHIKRRPETFLTKLRDRFRSDEERWREDWPPMVLFGYPGSEPVLEELAQEERYRLLSERSLRYAKVYREMERNR